MADISQHFQSQKVKGQGHQAALGGCSSHHLQEAGHIVHGGRTIGRTGCFKAETLPFFSSNYI